MSENNVEIECFFKEAKELRALLEGYRGFFDPDFLHQVDFEIESLQKNLSMSEEDAKTLKIGVVGAMKAGKSSFLNMLLFKGKDYLPKAATPMTAALTKIKYSDDSKHHVTIHFYSEEDWGRVEEYDKLYQDGLERAYAEYCRKIKKEDEEAQKQMYGGPSGTIVQRKTPLSKEYFEQKEYKPNDFERGAHEVVQKFETSGEDLREKLGTEENLEGKDLTALLEDFVGANGKYTPIVNYVKLAIPQKELQGVEIVDMPGLGDPIVSRGQVTKKFIKQCNVVIFLSTCSQFLPDRDMGLLTNMLPSAGIQNGLIIASRFDGGITGYKKRTTLDEACRKERLRLNKCYNEQIQKLPLSLRNGFLSHPLLVTSSMAYTLMRKREAGIELSGDEPCVYKTLKEMNGNSDLSANELRSLSGITRVKLELRKLQEKKQEILSKDKEEFVKTGRKNLKQLIMQLLDAVQASIRRSEKEDVASARMKRQKMESALDRAATSIASHFIEAELTAQKHIQELSANLILLREKYGSLVVEETKTPKTRTTKGGFLGLRKDTYQYTITTFSLETAQIEEQIALYSADCQKQIAHSFDFLVDTDTLRRSVTDVVLNALGDDDFDEEEILSSLRTTFAKIKLPPFEIDPCEYIDEVHNRYPGGVAKNAKIHEAKQLLSTLLSIIHQDISKKLQAAAKEIASILENQSTEFAASLRKNMGSELQRVENLCADKEKNIRELRNFIDALHEIQEKWKNEI